MVIPVLNKALKPQCLVNSMLSITAIRRQKSQNGGEASLVPFIAELGDCRVICFIVGRLHCDN